MPAKKAKDQACAKCGDPMTDGYLIRPWSGSAGSQAQMWTTGRPPVPADFRIGPKKNNPWLTVHTWRCTGCGFLESYAR